jgi:uncharacterized membrane protein
MMGTMTGMGGMMGGAFGMGWMMLLPALIGLALLVLIVLAIVWLARDLGTRRPDSGANPTRS